MATLQSPGEAPASTTNEAKADNPRKKVYFVPLENNPDVMTTLVHNLGFSSDLSWHDVFSIDDPELLAFVPRPSNAMLLVFPTSPTYQKMRAEEDGPKSEYTASGPQEPVLWFKQTIGNACGLYGLLHAVCNGINREFIAPSSILSKIIADATPLEPVARTRVLEEEPQLAKAHATAAAQGDTTAPPAEDNVDLHFVAFVKTADGHMWELDGSRKGPLARGQLPDGEDILGETALSLGPKKFIKRESEAGAGAELRFSILALGPSTG